MGSAITYVVGWFLPAVIAYFVGRRRARRGWLYGILGGWIGLGILWFLPDLTKSPEERQRLKQEKKRGKELTQATGALEAAKARHVLGKYGKVTLYEDGLVTAEGSCPLSAEINATVQDAGSLQKYVTSRMTLTRVATIGIFAIGAKKKKTHTVDTRELYLLIETPDFDSLVPCSPSHGPRVRQFATQINNAGKQADALLAEREHRIAAAEAAVSEIEARERLNALPA